MKKKNIRRHFPRTRVHIPVKMKIKYMVDGTPAGYEQRGVISDLSVGGAFILKSPEFSPFELKALSTRQAKVILEFILPPSKIAIMAQGRFRWALKNDEIPGCSGIGIAFDTIATEDILEIVRYTQSEEAQHESQSKRVHPRVDTSIKINLAKNIKSKVNNISASGLCFTTSPALSKDFIKSIDGKFLNIKLKLENKKVALRGKVVRLDKIKAKGQTGTKLGITFHDTPSHDHKILSGYVLVNQNKRKSRQLSTVA